MAYASTSRASSGILETIRSAIVSLFSGFAQRSVYNRTYNELSRLTDRELEDIGLHRCDIKATCTAVAYR
ncbi:DUF1127 domain-containing protein [Shimia sp. W99]